MSPVRDDASPIKASSATSKDVVASRESTETKHKPSWHTYLDKLSNLKRSDDPNTATKEGAMDVCHEPVDSVAAGVAVGSANDSIRTIVSSESCNIHRTTMRAPADLLATTTTLTTNSFVASISDPSVPIAGSSDVTVTSGGRSTPHTSK